MRETLFNWINDLLPGARCLELYAGSGILSMEALSRGARHVTMVEKDTRTCEALLANLRMLGAVDDSFSVVCQPAQEWMATSRDALFDVIFLDPPFAGDDLPAVLASLNNKHLLAPEGFIYCESGHVLPEASLPAGFTVHRQKKAGQVHYCLLKPRALF